MEEPREKLNIKEEKKSEPPILERETDSDNTIKELLEGFEKLGLTTSNGYQLKSFILSNGSGQTDQQEQKTWNRQDDGITIVGKEGKMNLKEIEEHLQLRVDTLKTSDFSGSGFTIPGLKVFVSSAIREILLNRFGLRMRFDGEIQDENKIKIDSFLISEAPDSQIQQRLNVHLVFVQVGDLRGSWGNAVLKKTSGNLSDRSIIHQNCVILNRLPKKLFLSAIVDGLTVLEGNTVKDLIKREIKSVERVKDNRSLYNRAIQTDFLIVFCVGTRIFLSIL